MKILKWYLTALSSGYGACWAVRDGGRDHGHAEQAPGQKQRLVMATGACVGDSAGWRRRDSRASRGVVTQVLRGGAAALFRGPGNLPTDRPDAPEYGARGGSRR